MLPEAKAVIDAWAEQGRPIYERMVELGEEAVMIANRSRAYSPRDVHSYEDVKGTLKALTAARPPPLPTHYVHAMDEQERRLASEAERIENPEAEARPKPRRLILRRRQPVARSPSPSARRICRRRSSCCCWSRTSR
jgi:hypothetical protein